jgi:hypothetical protein
MKTGIVRSIMLLMIFTSVLNGCSTKSKYDSKLKRELSSGIRNDSLFMGLYLGMPEKDFYSHCWELNHKGLVRQGPKNTTVEFILKNELKYPGTMDFYPSFVKGKIAEMPVRFIYTGWAPWNKKLSSDSLQVDVLNWFQGKYGNHFMKVDHPKRGSAFVQLKGNRRITIFKENEMNVWAVFTDMSVMKEASDTSGVGITPADSTKGIK